jgi:hypothetical protein
MNSYIQSIVTLIFLILFMTSCNEVRSVSEEQAKALAPPGGYLEDQPPTMPTIGAPTDRSSRRPSRPLISPVYGADIDAVQDAIVRACVSYTHKVEKDDRMLRKVQLIDTNVWAGNTETFFTLVKQADGKIRIDAESHSHGNPSAHGIREIHVIREVFSRIDAEMKLPNTSKPTTEARLKELERIHEQHLITEDEYRAKREQILNGL